MVSHAGDVAPGQIRLGREQLIDVFDRLADLDETDAHGVEDQSVGQGAPLQVRGDRGSRQPGCRRAADDPVSQGNGLGKNRRSEG